MEPLFVCEFTPTVKMIASRIRHYSLVRWIFLLVIGVFMVHSVLLPSIFYLSFGFELLWVLMAVVSVVIILHSLFFCEVNAYLSLRRYRKNWDSEGRFICRFGDTMELQQGKILTVLGYSEITAVVSLKYTYELKMGKGKAIFIDPRCFTKGTFEEFKQFLREKCPGLRIPE